MNFFCIITIFHKLTFFIVKYEQMASNRRSFSCDKKEPIKSQQLQHNYKKKMLVGITKVYRMNYEKTVISVLSYRRRFFCTLSSKIIVRRPTLQTTNIYFSKSLLSSLLFRSPNSYSPFDL